MNPAGGFVAMNPARGFVAMNPARGFATNPGAWIRDDTSSTEKWIENPARAWVRDLAEIENPACIWVCREPRLELGSLPTQSHELGSWRTQSRSQSRKLGSSWVRDEPRRLGSSQTRELGSPEDMFYFSSIFLHMARHGSIICTT
ncbi:hypothetical protein SLEP1_g22536 [Rubroshorea leprosula]|uniref:Uncharacterized protein n=1 Tax=Rubroshorea leprosula TaxID=152421 RepID=A0AAV5JGT6_9ROSI|nr:hypothetical protein SLEP1_g22536 [Rubroshorea leprosula]